MKKVTILIIFTVLVFKANAQEQVKNYYNNGQLKSIGSYDQSTSDYGVKKGEWKTYYENGQLKSIGSHEKVGAYNYKTQHGEWKFYYDNGQLSEISNYSVGRKKGESKTYYKNGQLKESVSYKSNSVIGRTKKIGASRLYFENGKLNQTGNYADDEDWYSDVKTGEWKIYHENGQLNSIENYSVNDAESNSFVSGNINEQSSSSTDSQLNSARLSYDNATTLYKRNKTLFDKGLISKQDVKNSKLALNQAKESLTQAQNDYQTTRSDTVGDSNSFESVKIGNQDWMSKNLNVSNFKNGEPIPQAQSKEAWDKAGETGSPAWCYYENDSNNGAILGKLYNWYAVNDARGLAPSGWHIPSDEEWTVLTDQLGGKEKAGIKMKSMSMWNDYENKREEGVFEALPGGIRLNGKFKNGGINGAKTYWWSSSETLFRGLAYYAEFVNRSGWGKPTGISVRCVKD